MHHTPSYQARIGTSLCKKVILPFNRNEYSLVSDWKPSFPVSYRNTSLHQAGVFPLRLIPV